MLVLFAAAPNFCKYASYNPNRTPVVKALTSCEQSFM